MNFGTSHDVAANSATVSTVVELLIDDARPFSRTPWRVTSRVTGRPAFRSYHRTRNGASTQADIKHAASLAENGGKGTQQ